MWQMVPVQFFFICEVDLKKDDHLFHFVILVHAPGEVRKILAQIWNMKSVLTINILKPYLETCLETLLPYKHKLLTRRLNRTSVNWHANLYFNVWSRVCVNVGLLSWWIFMFENLVHMKYMKYVEYGWNLTRWSHLISAL